MKEKVWLLNKTSLGEEIFYEQRFNVRAYPIEFPIDLFLLFFRPRLFKYHMINWRSELDGRASITSSLNSFSYDIILETFVNLSHNNISESAQNELRTSGGLDLVIDAVHSIVQDLSNNDFECYSLAELSVRIKKACRLINLLEEFSNESSEQISSNTNINRMYITRYHQYSLFHSLSK